MATEPKKNRNKAHEEAKEIRNSGKDDAIAIRVDDRQLKTFLLNRKIINNFPTRFYPLVIKGIKRLRDQYGSDSALSRASGISQPSINKILSDKQVPRLDAVSVFMDMIDARLVFPWDKENLTRKISIAGKGGDHQYREVIRYAFTDDAIAATDETGMVLPEEMLKGFSETLTIGVLTLQDTMRGMMPMLAPGDDVLVDFTQKPVPGENAPGVYFVRMPDKTVVCKKVSMEGRSYHAYDLDHRAAPLSLVEGRDYDNIEDAIIGKIVFMMGGMAGRL